MPEARCAGPRRKVSVQSRDHIVPAFDVPEDSEPAEVVMPDGIVGVLNRIRTSLWSVAPPSGCHPDTNGGSEVSQSP